MCNCNECTILEDGKKGGEETTHTVPFSTNSSARSCNKLSFNHEIRYVISDSLVDGVVSASVESDAAAAAVGVVEELGAGT